jgi:FG-GAP-like repeat
VNSVLSVVGLLLCDELDELLAGVVGVVATILTEVQGKSRLRPECGRFPTTSSDNNQTNNMTPDQPCFWTTSHWRRTPSRLTGHFSGYQFCLPALLGLFVVTLWLGAQGVATRNAPPAPRGAASGKPFLAKFTDIAAQAGLSVRFTSGNETAKKYIIEANGTGVAFVDFDNDGRLDIFLVNGSRLEGNGADPSPTNHLYRNTGANEFADVTTTAGVGRSGWGSGVCAGDVNNDSHLDLYVTYWGPNVLYRNRGDGTFEDITTASRVAVPPKQWSSGCTFLDYDRDGNLDLLVTSYQAFDLATAPLPGKASNCEWKGMPVFCGPRGGPLPQPRESNFRGHHRKLWCGNGQRFLCLHTCSC